MVVFEIYGRTNVRKTYREPRYMENPIDISPSTACFMPQSMRVLWPWRLVKTWKSIQYAQEIHAQDLSHGQILYFQDHGGECPWIFELWL
jgi:hypothetical protein